MSLSLVPQIGAIAGWKLELAVVTPGSPPTRGPAMTFSSDQYRGRIDAGMVSGLAAGSYTAVVEDVSDSDFQTLSARARGKSPLQARLYLYWIDAPGPGITGDGLVAVLRVTALRRRAGKWRYELVVEGREWVYDRMQLPCPALTGSGALGTAAAIARELHIELDPPPAPAESSEKRTTDPTKRAVEVMTDLERAMVAEAAAAKRPRGTLGMYLIRDGKLRLGPDRIREPAALSLLDARSGLLALERNGSIREDDKPVDPDDIDPPRRDLFIATLRGRPDLKPGDIVQFDAPEAGPSGEDLGFALGPPPITLPGGDGTPTRVTAYVQEVTHRLSREQGFLTVVHCVSAAPGLGKSLVDRLWFQGAQTSSASSAGKSESWLAATFQRISDAARLDRLPDVAQVRAHHLDEGDAPAQTETLWRGLADPDGAPYAAARQAFAKVKKQLAAAPYATAFAYGKCGLVVPRYPGTRVLVVNRAGDPDDPIDVGALWTRGHAPDQAHVGDWWLILPVFDGDQTPRAAVDDDDAAEPQASLATQDLIDAAGSRVIEVGKLTIRIGKNGLRPAGERPPAADDPVTIEHDSGKARIVIAQDGAITIESAKTLTLKGEDGITLDSGKGVTITVGASVDVKKR